MRRRGKGEEGGGQVCSILHLKPNFLLNISAENFKCYQYLGHAYYSTFTLTRTLPPSHHPYLTPPHPTSPQHTFYIHQAQRMKYILVQTCGHHSNISGCMVHQDCGEARGEGDGVEDIPALITAVIWWKEMSSAEGLQEEGTNKERSCVLCTWQHRKCQ